MNRLKYIFRVNLPHRVSSNAAQPLSKYHSGSCCKRRQPRLRFAKSNKFLSSARETLLSNYYLAGAQYKEKFAHKYANNVSRKCIQTCPQEKRDQASICIDPEVQKRPLVTNPESSGSCSTWEPTIRNNVNFNALQNNAYKTNDQHNGFSERCPEPNSRQSNCNLAQTQTEVRTYAQMIADYSELMYVKQSAMPPRMYIVEKNTLDASQKVATKDRKAESRKLSIYSTRLCRDIRSARSSSPGSFGQSVRFNSGGPPNQFDRMESNEYETVRVLSNPIVCTATDEAQESRSYAKMISDYSAQLYMQASSYLASPNANAEDESSRKNALESVWMMSDEKKNTDASQDENVAVGASEYSSYSPNNRRDHDNCKRLNENEEPEPPTDIKFKAEPKPPKQLKQASATDYSEFNDFPTISVADLLDMTEPKWLQRTVGSHKLETIAMDPANPLKHSESLGVPNTGHGVHFPKAAAADVMEAKQGGASGSTPNMSNLGGQGAHTAATTAKKHPRHPTATTTPTRPQVELQMAASSNGSVVSINVDRVKALSAMNAAEGNELSVVVRSNKSGASAGQTDGKQLHSSGVQKSGSHAGQRTDYGPMRFSIAEESAPVKQIEFSINGQPASEVKSITALAEKLDVVSSIGALEVRVPFSRNAAGEASAGSMAKNLYASGPVLNVRISAKFDRPTADRAADLTAKTPKVPKEAPKPKTPESPKAHYAFKTPTTQDDKKTKVGNLNIPNKDNKGGGGKSGTGTTTPPGAVGRVPGGKGPQGGFKASESELFKDESKGNVDVARDLTSSAYANERIDGRVVTAGGEDKETKLSPKVDERIPSKMIPWWSSDDAFRNIRKIDNSHEAWSNRKISPDKSAEIKKVEAMHSDIERQGKSNSGSGTGNGPLSQETSGEKKMESALQGTSDGQQDKSDLRSVDLLRTKLSEAQNVDAIKFIKTELKNDPDKIEIKDFRTVNTKVPVPIKIAEKLNKNTTYTLFNPNVVNQKDEMKQKQVQLKASKGDPQDPTRVNQQNVKVEPMKENDAVKMALKSSAESGTKQPADHASMKKASMSEGSGDKKNSNQSSISKVPATETKQLPESKAVKELDDSYAKLIRETKYTGKTNRMVSERPDGKKFKKSADVAEPKLLPSPNVIPKKIEVAAVQKVEVAASKNTPANPNKEKNVFDSIRPIEKRQDGTLIDFGVKVSSRGKPEKYRIRVRPNRDAGSFSKKLKDASAEKLKMTEKTSKSDVTVQDRGTPSKEQKETKKSASTDIPPANASKQDESRVQSENNTKSPKDDKDSKPSGTVKFTAYAPQVEETSTTRKDAVHPRSASAESPRQPVLAGTVVQKTLKQLPAKTTKPASASKIPTSLVPTNLAPVMSPSLKRPAKTSEPTLKGTIVLHPANRLQYKTQNSTACSSEFTPYEDFGQPSFIPFAGTIINARPMKDLSLSEKSKESFPLAGTINQSNKRWHKKAVEVQGVSNIEISKQSKTQLFNSIGKEQSQFATDAHGPRSNAGGESSGIVNSPKACPNIASDTSTNFSSMNRNEDHQDVPSSFAQGRRMLAENKTQQKTWHEGLNATHDRNVPHTHPSRTDTPTDMFYVNVTDRPEKNLLYSIWLRRFKDVNQSV